MKPKAQNEHEEGLLEYLEDIIGTSRFKQPIEEQQKLLEQLTDERDEKLTRLKIVEKDKLSLEVPFWIYTTNSVLTIGCDDKTVKKRGDFGLYSVGEWART